MCIHCEQWGHHKQIRAGTAGHKVPSICLRLLMSVQMQAITHFDDGSSDGAKPRVLEILNRCGITLVSWHQPWHLAAHSLWLPPSRCVLAWLPVSGRSKVTPTTTSVPETIQARILVKSISALFAFDGLRIQFNMQTKRKSLRDA